MWKKIALALVSLVILAIVGYLIWAANPPDIGSDAQAALISNENVEIVEDKKGGVTFKPKNPSNTALVFYPGARVRPASYAPEMLAIAEAGYTVIVPHMPFNMAVFDVDIADSIIRNHPEISHWVIGGHSLGGAMAASYTDDNRDQIEGILFWASYPPPKTLLTDFIGPITSISAELDGLATPKKVNDAKPNLPEQTEYVVIKGGNHAQFADYGSQKGDNPAIISSQEQWQQIIEASLDLLSNFD